MSAMRESCSNSEKRSPCACMEVKSESVRKYTDAVVVFQYPEFSCNEEVNERRRKEGRIPDGFVCRQLVDERTVHRYCD